MYFTSIYTDIKATATIVEATPTRPVYTLPSIDTRVRVTLVKNVCLTVDAIDA